MTMSEVDKIRTLGDALDAVGPRARDLDAGLDGLGTGVHRQHEVLAAELRERRGERFEPERLFEPFWKTR